MNPWRRAMAARRGGFRAVRQSRRPGGAAARGPLRHSPIDRRRTGPRRRPRRAAAVLLGAVFAVLAGGRVAALHIGEVMACGALGPVYRRSGAEAEP